ncbi:unnamed protein product [Arabidopsis lyrata]|uniref:Uncharacterized protein n=1 Tax=Arabidopsis lyrata subsp. lyrata TaxID=81972 RepID=D7MML4_ARALL|nr:hypothetical protein ARALYDRAFT_917798 [Arabidopsis lyrata subsp. lyrata]CAH8278917.1 unnamed protein product [Arabidopsis lyrata]
MSVDMNASITITGVVPKAMDCNSRSVIKLKKVNKYNQTARNERLVSMVDLEKAVREVLNLFGLLTTQSYS